MERETHLSTISHPIMSSEAVPGYRRSSIPRLTSQSGHRHRKRPSATELPNMSHRHHSQLPHNYPGPAYPPSNYHPTSRHVSNGPPPPVMMSAPQNMPMSGPPEPMSHMSNGHGHSHAPHAPQMSAAARIGKENMEKTLAQLANANENTWMLIGKWLWITSYRELTDRCRRRAGPGSGQGVASFRDCTQAQSQLDSSLECCSFHRKESG